jgi:hypothetical protein
MPTQTGKDAQGCYAQWGNHGKRYYYTCGDDAARGRARKKADAQGRAAHAGGYAGNQGVPKMFQYVVTNFKPVVRKDAMGSRDWLVAPVIMMTEGVHKGSAGPIYYPSDELGKLPVAWNHKPVVVYHPQRNGMPVTACDPIELTARGIGVLMNTQFDREGKKLRSEAWLQPERMAAIDDRIGKAIDKNEMMEVSTGLFMDLDMTEGEWNGEKYVGIARNLQPDHLALLPDLKGACSIADGAGFLRLNAAGDDFIFVMNGVDVTEDYIRIRQKQPGEFTDDSMKTIWLSKSKGIKAIIGKLKDPPEGQEGSTVVQSYLFVKDKWSESDAKEWVKKHEGTTAMQAVMNEISFDATRNLLYSLLKDKKADAWVSDVFDGYFIYELDGKTFRQDYEITDGTAKFIGLPVHVERQVTYKEVTLAASNKSNQNSSNMKGKAMDKGKIVDALIANENTVWTDADRDKLMALDETVLAGISELLKANEDTAKKASDNKQDATVTQNAQTNADNKPMTDDEYIANAPAKLRQLWTAGMKALSDQKESLIAIIIGNKANTFTKEFLLTKEPDELMALAKLAGGDPAKKPAAMFIGQGEVPQGGAPTEGLPLPKMEFKKAG